MVSGYAWDNSNTFYQRNWKKFSTPFINYQTEYSLALGNHDTQANLNRTEII